MTIKTAFLLLPLLLLASCSGVSEVLNAYEYQPLTAEDLASDELMVSPVDQATGELISFRERYLTFGFPSSAGWRFYSYNDEHAVRILVPDANYEVFLNLKITRLTEFQDVSDAASEKVTLENGAVLYRIPFGGGYDMAYVNFEDETYEITVDVSSSEPVPENLDGVWAPHTDVTREDLWAFYQTVNRSPSSSF